MAIVAKITKMNGGLLTIPFQPGIAYFYTSITHVKQGICHNYKHGGTTFEKPLKI